MTKPGVDKTNLLHPVVEGLLSTFIASHSGTTNGRVVVPGTLSLWLAVEHRVPFLWELLREDGTVKWR